MDTGTFMDDKRSKPVTKTIFKHAVMVPAGGVHALLGIALVLKSITSYLLENVIFMQKCTVYGNCVSFKA